MRKRLLLFVIGFVIGGLMFLVGGVNWQPAAPACSGCAVLNSNIHNAQCSEAVEGGWVCEGR
jgi:hypothetical protein